MRAASRFLFGLAPRRSLPVFTPAAPQLPPVPSKKIIALDILSVALVLGFPLSRFPDGR
jgi:hypothetical protein